MILRNMGNVKVAFQVAAEEERVWRDLKDEDELQRCLGNQAGFLREDGRFSDSLHCLNEQERLCRQLQNLRSLVYALAGKASLLRRDLNRPAEAKLMAEEGLRIARDCGLTELVQRLQEELAILRSTIPGDIDVTSGAARLPNKPTFRSRASLVLTYVATRTKRIAAILLPSSLFSRSAPRRARGARVDTGDDRDNEHDRLLFAAKDEYETTGKVGTFSSAYSEEVRLDLLRWAAEIICIARAATPPQQLTEWEVVFNVIADHFKYKAAEIYSKTCSSSMPRLSSLKKVLDPMDQAIDVPLKRGIARTRQRLICGSSIPRPK